VRRREFISLLGGTAAAWPLAASGQTPPKIARIGVLRVARASPTTAASWNAFFDELSAHGYRIGDNILADMRWVDEDPSGAQELAAELVRSSVDVLVVDGQEANLKAAVDATGTIPIVMAVSNYDPVARGYIKNLARPGGNITGLSVLVAHSVQMLLVQSSPLFAPYGKRIAEAAIEHRLPSMFIVRSYVDRGGLMAYGADRVAATRLAGTYVARILKGAKPADLPVEQPTKYELIVNLKTAKAIGVELPTAILLRADEVIE
jgi:ABC-type uncharacterized transport system substrate-binding protein